MKWTLADVPAQNAKLAIVTGGNSGIGFHTAVELARAGAQVILTARDDAKGSQAVQKIKQEIPRAAVRYEILDLASLASIHAFSERLSSDTVLDLLVNNAGVMMVPERRLTSDGFELQFGTNFLGHFALTALLLPMLRRAATPRVTSISSGAANMGRKAINFDDPQWEKSYSPWKAYCQSKLANLLFMTELGRRSAAAGILLVSNAAHPGWARTNLQTAGPGRDLKMLERVATKLFSQDAAHGALPTVRAATELGARSDSYFAPSGLLSLRGDPVPISLPKPARDLAAAKRLWELAEQLTSTSFHFEN